LETGNWKLIRLGRMKIENFITNLNKLTKKTATGAEYNLGTIKLLQPLIMAKKQLRFALLTVHD